MKRIALITAAALSACGVEEASFVSEEAWLEALPEEGTPPAVGALLAANDCATTAAALTGAGMYASAAAALTAARDGADGACGTADDTRFRLLADLLAVSGVGGASVATLVGWAEEQGRVPVYAGGTADGVTFTDQEAYRALVVANRASFTELDQWAGLRSDTSQEIVTARPSPSLAALAGVRLVGTTALETLKAYANPPAPPPPSLVPDRLAAIRFEALFFGSADQPLHFSVQGARVATVRPYQQSYCPTSSCSWCTPTAFSDDYVVKATVTDPAVLQQAFADRTLALGLSLEQCPATWYTGNCAHYAWSRAILVAEDGSETSVNLYDKNLEGLTAEEDCDRMSDTACPSSMWASCYASRLYSPDAFEKTSSSALPAALFSPTVEEITYALSSLRWYLNTADPTPGAGQMTAKTLSTNRTRISTLRGRLSAAINDVQAGLIAEALAEIAAARARSDDHLAPANSTLTDWLMGEVRVQFAVRLDAAAALVRALQP